MRYEILRLITLLAFVGLLFIGCSSNNNDSYEKNKKNTSSNTEFDICNLYNKWYYDHKDEDKWIEFLQGNEFKYKYYQYYGQNSSINAYITKTGKYSIKRIDGKVFLNLTLYHRSALDNSYTPDEIGGVYEIIELGENELIINDTHQLYGSAAYQNNGVYFDVSQVTPKVKVVLDVPDELVSDKWYYDNNDLNKWIKFDPDGTCWYRHYQNYGSNSSINGYVSSKGTYRYSNNENKKVINICLNGEVNRDYIVVKLTTTDLVLEKKSDSAGWQSWMYENNGKYFR